MRQVEAKSHMKIYTYALSIALIIVISLIPLSRVNAQEGSASDKITTYIVQKGDTLSEIAEKFDITTNTILWANDLQKDSKIKIGQELVILPVSGVQYTVKSGDAVESIARRFKADKQEIIDHNNLGNNSLIKIGDVLVIPGVATHIIATNAPANKSSNTVTKTVSASVTAVKDVSQKVAAVLFAKPVEAATKTQGIHGNNAVDLAASEDTPILAAADGEVAISQDGWNGGYGTYVVINHSNGTQTLYAHNSENLVSVGEKVTQGQIIAYMGSTGKSTGDHVHFEVRGSKNPF